MNSKITRFSSDKEPTMLRYEFNFEIKINGMPFLVEGVEDLDRLVTLIQRIRNIGNI